MAEVFDELEFSSSLSMSRGHFIYESGHHGDLWLELDGLFRQPSKTNGWVKQLCVLLAQLEFEYVCGPLLGGGFIGYAMAAALGKQFIYSERKVNADGMAVYGIPEPEQRLLAEKKVLVVDDAINAGSAIRATHRELVHCGAEVVGFASFLTLGGARERIANEFGAPCMSLKDIDRQMWPAKSCPLCAAAVPIQNI
ncbi:MAG: phosphoribosyltransferase family protein [Stappiaceae bacterium]